MIIAMNISNKIKATGKLKRSCSGMESTYVMLTFIRLVKSWFPNNKNNMVVKIPTSIQNIRFAKLMEPLFIIPLALAEIVLLPQT